MLRATILACLVASCASAPTPAGALREHIAQAWEQHIAAAIAKDLDGVLAIYDDEFVFVIPGSTRVAGLEDIADMERAAMASSDVLHARHTLHELRVDGNLAYELGTIEGPVRSGAGPAQVVTFPYMARWARGDDGRWLLTYQVGR